MPFSFLYVPFFLDFDTPGSKYAFSKTNEHLSPKKMCVTFKVRAYVYQSKGVKHYQLYHYNTPPKKTLKKLPSYRSTI